MNLWALWISLAAADEDYCDGRKLFGHITSLSGPGFAEPLLNPDILGENQISVRTKLVLIRRVGAYAYTEAYAGIPLCEGDVLRNWEYTTVRFLTADQSQAFLVHPHSVILLKWDTDQSDQPVLRLKSGSLVASSYDPSTTAAPLTTTRVDVGDSSAGVARSTWSVAAAPVGCVCLEDVEDCGCPVNLTVAVSTRNDPNGLDAPVNTSDPATPDSGGHSVWVWKTGQRPEDGERVVGGEAKRFAENWRTRGVADPLPPDEVARLQGSLERGADALYPTLVQSRHFSEEERLRQIEHGNIEIWTSPAGYKLLPVRYSSLTDADQDPFEDYQIGAEEVTQELYGSLTPIDTTLDPTCWSEPGVEAGPQYPMVCLTWLEAVLFANALSEAEHLAAAYQIDRAWNGAPTVRLSPRTPGYRLPTLDQWQRAAHAGGTYRYGVSHAPHKVCGFANIAGEETITAWGWNELQVFPCRDGHTGLAPVGTLEPNAWGLRDPLGNAAEWIWGGDLVHQALGAGWRSNAEVDPFTPREAPHDRRYPDVGVRLVRPMSADGLSPTAPP